MPANRLAELDKTKANRLASLDEVAMPVPPVEEAAPAATSQMAFQARPEPGIWEKIKQTVSPEYEYGRITPPGIKEEPQEKLLKAMNLPMNILTGYSGGRGLGVDKLLWYGIGKAYPKTGQKGLEETLKSISPYKPGYTQGVRDISRWIGGIQTAAKGLKRLGWKSPTGKEYLKRLGRNAPPWMTEATVTSLIDGITEELGLTGTAKKVLQKTVLAGVGAAAWSGIARVGGIGLDVLRGKLPTGGRLPPGELLKRGKIGSETWKTVFGRTQISAEPIPTAPGAPKPRIRVTADMRPVLNPVEKLTQWIKGARIGGKYQEAVRAPEKAKKAAKLATVFEKERGWTAYRKALASQKGELTALEITPPEGSGLTPADITNLADRITTSDKVLPYQKLNALDGLHKLLGEKKIPGAYNLVQLEKVFGKDFVKAVIGKRPFSQKAWDAAFDLLNFPRSLLASADLSASLRQTAITGTRHPILWTKAFGKQTQAFFSAKNALAYDKVLRGSKWFSTAEKSGLFLPEIGRASQVRAQYPEEFMSRFAEHFPLVKRSEYAFITMTNKLRFDVYSKYADKFSKAGITPKSSPKHYKALAEVLNAATGRGNMGEILNKWGGELNALFFSPRYVISRPQALWHAIPKFGLGEMPWEVRKIAMGQMATFFGTSFSLLALIDKFSGDDVTVDWKTTSPDFAKIKYGNVRYDTLAGYQQMGRYYFQAIKEEATAANTKRKYKTDWKKVLTRATRSKLSPAASFIWDSWTGTTFVGDPMNLKPSTIGSQAFQRLVPLSIQDTLEAFAYEGAGAGLATLPAATLGIGVVAFPPSQFQQIAMLEDEKARLYYQAEWRELTERQQLLISREHPEIGQMRKAAKASSVGIPYIEGQLVEQQASKERLTKSLSPAIQKEMKRLNVAVGGISRTVGDSHYLNDKRYKKYQDLVAENTNQLVLKQLGTSRWRGSSDLNKQRLLEAYIKAGREMGLVKYRAWEHKK